MLPPQTIQMAFIKKFTNKKFWRGVEEIEPSCTVGENITWYSHSGKQCGG